MKPDDDTVTCRDIKGNKVEVLRRDLSFRPSIYGVIIEGDSVLLVPQWDGYDFPGGGVDLGERLVEGLIREVKEETGLDVEVGEALHVVDNFFIHLSGKPMHCVLIYHLCRVVGGELSTAGFDEHEKTYAQMAEWVPVEQAKSLKFYSPIDCAALIQKALSGTQKQS